MSEKSTTALVLLVIVAFLMWLYNKGYLKQIVSIIKTGSTTTTVSPMPISATNGLTTSPGTPAIPYLSNSTYLPAQNFGGNTINNPGLAYATGLTGAGVNSPSNSNNPESATGLLEAYEMLTAGLGGL